MFWNHRKYVGEVLDAKKTYFYIILDMNRFSLSDQQRC